MCSVLTLLDLSAEFDMVSPFTMGEKKKRKFLPIALTLFSFAFSSSFWTHHHSKSVSFQSQSLFLSSRSPPQQLYSSGLCGPHFSFSPVFPLAILFPRWLQLWTLFTGLLHQDSPQPYLYGDRAPVSTLFWLSPPTFSSSSSSSSLHS